MSKKTQQKIKVNKENQGKWAKVSFYTLLFLVIEIAVCIVISWLSGNTELTKIQDNVLTALLQNYNYLLGTACLIPVIGCLFSKIKDELNKRLFSDSQMVMYGFLGVIVTLVAVIAVCSIVYPINSSIR